MESFEDFKKRIWALSPTEQLAELNNRDIEEKKAEIQERLSQLPEYYSDTELPVNLNKHCPHCSGSNIILVNIESYNNKRMLCRGCKAQWNLDAKGAHYLSINFHRTVCQYPLLDDAKAQEGNLGIGAEKA